jgi:radical SAM-linked protein
MKIRFRYTKLGKVRFLGHRDLARVWERALRRVEVPVAYTQGFSPRPKLAFGLALTTCAESDAEYLDVDLAAPADATDTTASPVDPDDLATRLSAALPVGVDILTAFMVTPVTPSLQFAISSCNWQIDLPSIELSVAQRAVRELLEADHVIVTRSRKGAEADDDIRPGVLALEVSQVPDGTGSRLVAELAAQPRALRPTELLTGLGLADDLVRLRRRNQWIRAGSRRWEPEHLQVDDWPGEGEPLNTDLPRTMAAPTQHHPDATVEPSVPGPGAAVEHGDTPPDGRRDTAARPLREERNDVRASGPRPPDAEPPPEPVGSGHRAGG